jgi:hypothetical protein
MENYPIHLIKQILQFVRGDKIFFNRNKSGHITEIIGISNDNVISKTLFDYESERISIYSFCDNQDDELHPSDLSFCDTHIRLPLSPYKHVKYSSGARYFTLKWGCIALQSFLQIQWYLCSSDRWRKHQVSISGNVILTRKPTWTGLRKLYCGLTRGGKENSWFRR